ncbi:MAG: nucleoside deaminase [Ignavibacteriales bacterium]|nr:nucleoside deaminase [Ignavibacteriota bacterium]MCB9250573.1 nucleoside deaminase [Ignavibacteriales bacterium]
MYAALQEAEFAFEKDEVPIGAVVVFENRIIGRGHNQTQMLNDSTAHAEMLAITAASNHLGSKILDKCDIYITVEPCVMCTGAILLSRIKNVYFGTFEPKQGAAGSQYNLLVDNKYNIDIKVYSGIYAEESKNLLQSFFKKKRNFTTDN